MVISLSRSCQCAQDTPDMSAARVQADWPGSLEVVTAKDPSWSRSVAEWKRGVFRHCERCDVDDLTDLLWIHSVERLAVEHLVEVFGILRITKADEHQHRLDACLEPCEDGDGLDGRLDVRQEVRGCEVRGDSKHRYDCADVSSEFGLEVCRLDGVLLRAWFAGMTQLLACLEIDAQYRRRPQWHQLSCLGTLLYMMQVFGARHSLGKRRLRTSLSCRILRRAALPEAAVRERHSSSSAPY